MIPRIGFGLGVYYCQHRTPIRDERGLSGLSESLQFEVHIYMFPAV